LVVVPQIAGRNITDDKRNPASCGVATTSKKGGATQPLKGAPTLFYKNKLVAVLQIAGREIKVAP